MPLLYNLCIVTNGIEGSQHFLLNKKKAEINTKSFTMHPVVAHVFQNQNKKGGGIKFTGKENDSTS